MHSNSNDETGLNRGETVEPPDRDFDHDRGCPKCDSQQVAVWEVVTADGTVSMMADIASNRFQTVACWDCGYSEFYRHTNTDEAELIDTFFE